MKGRGVIARGVQVQKRQMCHLSPFGERYGRGNVGNAGFTVTVFGATGALGSYVMPGLAKMGARVYAPYRGDDMEPRNLKPYFTLGQLGLLPYHPRDEESIYEAVKKSDIVINLIGKDYETKHLVPTRRADGSLSRINYPFDEVHSDIPARIARVSREAGVQTFIHVSALTANENSASGFSRSKAKGEQAVRKEFPDAIIVKPSVMFGYEDKFTNQIASFFTNPLFRLCPIVDGAGGKLQPVWSYDVAEAILQMVERCDEFSGQTFALAGKETYTYAELLVFIMYVTMRWKRFIDIPTPIANRIAKMCESYWLPYITRDFITRMAEGCVLPEKHDFLTFEDLNMKPYPLQTSMKWLHYYRPESHFAITQNYHKGAKRDF